MISPLLNNSMWMFGYRALRLGLGFILGAWLARNLGPEKFGILGYAIAAVAMFNTVAGMGIKDIVVTKLVQQPLHAGSIVGAAIGIRVMAGLVGYVALIFFIASMHPNDPEIMLITSALGITIIMSTYEVVKMWLEAGDRIRYTAWVDCSSFILLVVPRVYLLILEYPVVYFVCLLVIEAFVALLLYCIMLARSSLANTIQFSTQYARQILKESWPLLGSALSIVLYMKVDIIMLGSMVDSNSVGVYAVAAKISEIFFIIPTIICAVWLPSLAKLNAGDTGLDTVIQKILNYFLISSLAIAVIISAYSNLLIETVFGTDYKQSSAILAIHIWSCPLVFFGIAGAKWYTLNNLQTLTLFRTVLAAMVNIALNFLLIPHYGGIGAAVATVVAHLLADYLLDACNRKSRPLFRMKTRSLFGINYFFMFFKKTSALK